MGIQKMTTYFNKLKETQKNLFVPYIVAGDGGLHVLEERIDFLEKSGVAAIEIGIPFSDPVADGPTIQKAGTRALENGTTLKKVLTILEETKEGRNVPVVLMTYANPVYVYGIEQFAAHCERAGVDGLIIPDVPLEEEEPYQTAFRAHNLAFIRLAALTSTEERLKELAKRTKGFLYAVSVTGTTGVKESYDTRVYDYLQFLKEHCDVPVLAGFGVANAEQAHELGSFCDGVIVGSKIVDLFHKGKDNDIRQLIIDSTNK